MLLLVKPPKSASPLSQLLKLYATDALPPFRLKPSAPEVAGLARTYEYPAKTAMVLRSCACAATPKSEAKPSKDTTTLNFINPPFKLVFRRRPAYCRSTARFAECLRQEGSYPHLLCFLLLHTDAGKVVEVT